MGSHERPIADYGAKHRAQLDAKIIELRAQGWDVVARRERDLAWSERDDARDDLNAIITALDEHDAQWAHRHISKRPFVPLAVREAIDNAR